MFDLSGRIALVTGGSRGLGREMATGLAEQGADLVICSRSQTEVEGTAAEIAGATGRRVVGLAADVTERGAAAEPQGERPKTKTGAKSGAKRGARAGARGAAATGAPKRQRKARKAAE